VCWLYEQGKVVINAVVNSFFAVHQMKVGKATKILLGQGINIELLFVYETSIRSEYGSDIYGEGGILLGAVHGIVEVLIRRYIWQGIAPEDAFSESTTGNFVKVI